MPTIENNSLIVPETTMYCEKYDSETQETLCYHLLPGIYPIRMKWTTPYVNADVIVEHNPTQLKTATNMEVSLYEIFYPSVNKGG